MIRIKKKWEIERMKRAGLIVADVLKLMNDLIRPGVDTRSLDVRAEEMITKSGGVPAFKGYSFPGAPCPFPGSICVSINDEIVHGIPDPNRILMEGDIVSIDVGACFERYFSDAACTYPVGSVSTSKARLLEVTKEALYRAIRTAKAGSTLGDVGYTIEHFVTSQNYGLVRDYAGHGIGRNLHEAPQVLNFGRQGDGIVLKSGFTLAIEPMVIAGKNEEVIVLDNGWTVATADHSDAAHFEHTVLITEDGGVILTPWE